MLKVLIVEDEDIIRRGLVYTIDWMSMDCMVVGAAENGKKGLQLIEQFEPDVVLADIIMPEMSGIEMLAAAQKLAIKPFKSIFLTSYSNFEYARKALQLQAVDYLLKPIDEEELRTAIGRVAKSMETIKDYADLAAIAKKEQIITLVDWEVYLNQGTLNQYVAKALYQIRDHYDEKLSIESIAEQLDVSPSYLSRKFKEVTSQTFLDFLTRYRIQKAIGLLKKGSYKVYEVSEMTGFSDYKHFCLVFKKYTKTSPTEFVKHSGCIIHK